MEEKVYSQNDVNFIIRKRVKSINERMEALETDNALLQLELDKERNREYERREQRNESD